MSKPQLSIISVRPKTDAEPIKVYRYFIGCAEHTTTNVKSGYVTERWFKDGSSELREAVCRWAPGSVAVRLDVTESLVRPVSGRQSYTKMDVWAYWSESVKYAELSGEVDRRAQEEAAKRELKLKLAAELSKERADLEDSLRRVHELEVKFREAAFDE